MTTARLQAKSIEHARANITTLDEMMSDPHVSTQRLSLIASFMADGVKRAGDTAGVAVDLRICTEDMLLIAAALNFSAGMLGGIRVEQGRPL